MKMQSCKQIVSFNLGQRELLFEHRQLFFSENPSFAYGWINYFFLAVKLYKKCISSFESIAFSPSVTKANEAPKRVFAI